MGIAKSPVRRRAATRKLSAWAHTRGPLRLERRDAVREVVLDAAYRLYARDGSAGITMRALAEELRCAPTAVYRYFQNKDEIVAALKETAVRLMTRDELPPETGNPLGDLHAVYLRYYDFSKAHPVYFRLLWADASTDPYDASKPQFKALAALGENARDKVLRCIQAGLFSPDIDVNEICAALWCAVHGAATFRAAGVLAGADYDRMAGSALDLVIAGTPHRPSREE